MSAWLVTWGAWLMEKVSYLGGMTLFLLETLYGCFTLPLKGNRIVKQLWFIGWKSMPVICLTAAFTGMVLALQGHPILRRVGSEAFLGPFVDLALIRELGPVLTALMITGRAGSSITAQIGIMRINDQIDALELMGLNPLRYLAVPNFWAMVIAMPLLSAIFDVIAIFGGCAVGVGVLGLNAGVYFGEMTNYTIVQDVVSGVYKSMSFGLLVAWVCCYKGFHSRFGAEGVSTATTQAVVNASVLILVWDYLFGALLP